MMTNLSPATQAVLDAYEQSSEAYYEERGQLAAALCAVADQVVPLEHEIIDNLWYDKPNPIRDQILAIAKELKESK